MTEHDGRKDECICDWGGLPGDFDPDPACPQHGRADPVCSCDVELQRQDQHCPFHGERPWAVCRECNYDRHQCPGCGKPMRHGGPVACADCDTDDLPRSGLIIYETGESPYEPSGWWMSGPM